MTDLPARLQEALGDAYRIERELGGGGMSRLFVATERSLNRQVVVKILPPELTSEVSAARFKQEIEVAARLQHPHIVPILGAGASGDLLYYIMPYVRGESLRHRLVESGKLPVADAVRILAEVSRALGYAHRQGIVHRDIKPENILLEDGQAVLADFGVARAIVAARTSELDSTEEARPERFTATGLSVGTPTYMAPEQAAGETTLDSRADLYALAVVGYEMLTGEHPFAATSAQKMIVAHMTQPAPSVSKLRPETPIAVSAALARALEKDPEKRFRTAEDFRAALEGGAVHAPRAKSSLRYVVAGVALVALVAMGTFVARRGHEPPLDANLVAIAPFDVVDADLKLWHEGMVDVLSRNLDGAGPLRTVPPTLVVRGWTGHADIASASELGRATGAGLVVFGSVVHAGADSVRGYASVADAASGAVLGEVERSDVTSRMGRLSDSLAIGILRELGKSKRISGAEISSVGTTSFTALKAFLQGEQFFRRTQFDSANSYYLRAIAADSQFGIAYAHQGEALGWLKGDSAGIVPLTNAERFNHGLAPRDSILIEVESDFHDLTSLFNSGESYHRIYRQQKKLFATLEEASRLYPQDPLVWYKAGDARVHWGWGAGTGMSEREIVHFFDRAIALDSTFAPLYYHAITMAFRYGPSTGRRYVAAYLAQRPGGSMANAMRLDFDLTSPAIADRVLAQKTMDSASRQQLYFAAEAIQELGDSAEVSTSLWRAQLRKGIADGDPDSLDYAYQLASSLALRGHAMEAWRAYPNSILAAQLALIGALPRKLADSIFEAGRPHSCDICAIILRGSQGDTNGVRAVVRSADAFDRANKDPRQLSSPDDSLFTTAHVASAYLSLARHDTVTALAQFLALADSGCHVGCAWIKLPQVQLLMSTGRYPEAARILDDVGILDNRSPVIGTLLEFERGRVAEKMNDKPRAIDAYTYVADIWQNGDPAFQAYVSRARAGLNRLGDESRGTSIPLTKKN